MGLLVTRSRVGAVVFFLIAIAAAGFVVLRRAENTLTESQAEVAATSKVNFTDNVIHPAVMPGAELLRAPGGYRDAVEFGGRIYLGGASGLTAFSADGARIAEYRPGFELPPAKVVALRAHADELLIATDGAGLLSFHGREFRNILPSDPNARNLTSLLPLESGRLLLGTVKAGVLVYDGKHLTHLHAAISHEHVTAIAGDEADIWIGTLQHGAFRWHAGQLDHFESGGGLPDSQVLSLEAARDTAYVGTPLGVAEFRGGKFTRVLAEGYLARALELKPDRLLVGTEDEGVIEIPLSSRFGRKPSPDFDGGAVERLLGDLVLTPDAVYLGNGRRVLGGDTSALADRNISALGVEPGGRTWVGYFDRGLDISDGDHVHHIEDEHVFCVNRIAIEPGIRTAVATANGLVLFDASGVQRQVLRRADGLIADHVTDVMLQGDDMVVATPAGLTFVNRTGMRSLYAFQGLVNNHTYSLGGKPGELLVGTLGGLSVLQDGVVRASYTTVNSRLRHNWITSLARVGEEWFVGTYGAGVLSFKAGEWNTFPDLPKDFIVNPNAILVTPSRVLAGSLGKGLFCFDRGSRRWSALTGGLPSLNVTALAESGGVLLIGTDNGLVRMPERDIP
jgi:ligand-binding sensor domain-containing protein